MDIQQEQFLSRFRPGVLMAPWTAEINLPQAGRAGSAVPRQWLLRRHPKPRWQVRKFDTKAGTRRQLFADARLHVREEIAHLIVLPSSRHRIA
jgi:hypothetical protein